GNILKKDPVLSDEKQGKARDAMQVWANGGVYLFFCLADAVYPGLFLSTAAVSISISTSDTLSSEIGMALKGKTIDLLRLKKTTAGISGGISLAGSLAGLAGALAAAAICMISLEGISGEYWLIIALFGLAGMFIDSLLGSALQVKYFNEDLQAWSDRPTDRSSKRKGMVWIGNDTVNVLSQLLGCGIFLAWLFLARSH
ncbi:MAG: DUF92 domain-containing protein, partial [Bacteroidia bacterium]|nr:DUF92 domain-containing protein [Bacteroidia bacterium]